MEHKSRYASVTVLIVDDEPSILEILEQFFGERGYRVVTAGTAEAALALVARERIDVALIDLKLPDRTGLDLLEPLARANPHVKCIMMTAFASIESTIDALRLNAFDYVLKPFDLLRVGEMVEAAAQQSRHQRESDGVLDQLSMANRKLEESARTLGEKLSSINDELSRTNESLNRHVTRLRVLYQMGRDISSNENWGDALDRFLMALCKYLEAEGAGLFLFSNNAQSLKVRTSYQLDEALVQRALRALSQAQGSDTLPSEMFTLETCGGPRVKTCLEMTVRWQDTVIPLLYKGRWLGFLLVRKAYRSRRSYLADYHFINTIQTILTEEVANASTISHLRNLKDFNETVLENINSGVLTADRDGKVMFRNGRARELMGERGKEAILFDELFANPFGGGGLFGRIASQDEGNSSFECMLLRPGAGPIPVRVNTTTVRLDDHHGTTVIVIFEDLTRQKRMEDELRRADRLRSLGELSAGVAHEIRNPLTGIATTAQVLKERLGTDAEKGKFVDVILGEIARLDAIIKNLLDFARPVPPHASEIVLSRLIEDALALLTDKAGGRGVNLHFENQLRDDRLLLDGDQIKQVILNIALNGIEACGAGGRVNVYARDAVNPAFVQIELSDTGSGIPDDIGDKLYNPFFTTKTEGTGMGLSISRKIAEGHGGRVYYKSAPGKGASFFIELPRKMLVSAERPAARATE
ncbi:MAG: response regulator [Candidatus Krumholzibacteria bacterium]|nr:response regulator [Candidatus Krumholzibacteria bacterium]